MWYDCQCHIYPLETNDVDVLNYESPYDHIQRTKPIPHIRQQIASKYQHVKRGKP